VYGRIFRLEGLYHPRGGGGPAGACCQRCATAARGIRPGGKTREPGQQLRVRVSRRQPEHARAERTTGDGIAFTDDRHTGQTRRNTACGFHAFYGVGQQELTFAAPRLCSATAAARSPTVDDRGPLSADGTGTEPGTHRRRLGSAAAGSVCPAVKQGEGPAPPARASAVRVFARYVGRASRLRACGRWSVIRHGRFIVSVELRRRRSCGDWPVIRGPGPERSPTASYEERRYGVGRRAGRQGSRLCPDECSWRPTSPIPRGVARR